MIRNEGVTGSIVVQLHDCIRSSMPIAKRSHLGLVSAKSHVTPSAGTIA
jgi:hypothetical protein